MKKICWLFIFAAFIFTSCENDLEEVNALFSKDHVKIEEARDVQLLYSCLLYTSPSPRDATLSRMPSSA